ncbi:MAG: hypothetical protein IIB57_12505 [Planctomycetes bacterium]|nr:hypothetical protein [Planctomycetota bacterium]
MRIRPDGVLIVVGFGPILVQLIATILSFHGPESRYWTIESVLSYFKTPRTSRNIEFLAREALASARQCSDVFYPVVRSPARTVPRECRATLVVRKIRCSLEPIP